ncbi:DUF6789 family protein [Dethiobacter alkaliphilus]|uniref:DUF6789 family protein n=1 Tax=Dethiobacter alkaliphilus TaxID=427926 RepID=UPI00058FECA2|nr:DUF6789 family protein [Dethiobacter alkaliphilus]
MRDRFTNGFISGIVGSLIGVPISFILQALGFAEVQAVDFTAKLLYGRPAMMTSEIVWATIIGIGFAGIFGALFAYLILAIDSKYLYLKGLLYGPIVFYLWYSFVLLTIVGQVEVITLTTSIANTVANMIYGLVLAVAYNYLDEKELIGEDKALETEKVKIKKPLITSKKYTLLSEQTKELHHHRKTNIFGKAANKLLRRKKI